MKKKHLGTDKKASICLNGFKMLMYGITMAASSIF